MMEQCTAEEVVAAGYALHCVLEELHCRLHESVPGSGILLAIAEFMKKLKEKLPYFHDKVTFSRPSGLTFGFLRRILKQAADFVRLVVDKDTFSGECDLKKMEEQLQLIQESLVCAYQINVVVTALDVNIVGEEDEAAFEKGLCSLELMRANWNIHDAGVVEASPSKRLAAVHSVLQPVLVASTPEMIEAAVSTISHADGHTQDMRNFLDDVLSNLKELTHGVSRELEQKAVTYLRWYQDPLTWDTLVDPVKCNDGRTYDRWTILNNKVIRGPFDNRDPFHIVCDDVDVRGRLFEKFPEQEPCYLKLRSKYREEAVRKLEQGEYGEAILMLENVLNWAESDTVCKTLVVSAKCHLDEKNRRQASRDTDEPIFPAIPMSPQENPQIPGELQSWLGWFENENLSYNMSVELYLTSQNKLTGHGSDASGDWVLQGQCAGDDVKFQLRYVHPHDCHHQKTFNGKRRFKVDGTEYMEGDHDSSRSRGPFYLERVVSSTKTAHGQRWTGYWQDETSLECNPYNSEIVFTSHNKLFGSGDDEKGSFTYIGTYSQEGNRIKVVFLRIYKPETTPLVSHFWGQLFRGFSSVPTVMEGIWVESQLNGVLGVNGVFRLETTGFPGVFPSPLPTNRPAPRIPGVLESWKGWFEDDGLKKNMTAALYLTSSNRLCGYGNDHRGQWTWEGEYVDLHQVLLRKQYVTIPGDQEIYCGKKYFLEGKEILAGNWSRESNRGNSQKFLFQRETSSIKTAHGQLWTGYWQFSNDGQRGIDDTVFVFTSCNKLFGFGSDVEGKFTHTGNYSQEGNVLKITSLKLYEPPPVCTSAYVYYWGQLYLKFQASAVMEGQWSNVKRDGDGIFHLETRDFCTALSPPSVSSCMMAPHSEDELESWEGWHLQDGRILDITAELYTTSSNRLYGFGSDSTGEWTLEGDIVDLDQVELRRQSVVNPQDCMQYSGKRSTENGVDVIEGHWKVMSEDATENQLFFLKKKQAAPTKGYGQYWTGCWESSKEGNQRGLDDADFLFTSSNRIFGFGSDVHGTFTFLGNYTREPYTVQVKMAKVYGGGTSSSVQYCGHIDLQWLHATTMVLGGSWASLDGKGHGTFCFQTQDFHIETFISVAGPCSPSAQSEAFESMDD